jgi:hypothetical protein
MTTEQPGKSLLFLINEEPDPLQRTLMDALAQGNTCTEMRLGTDMDYSELIERIFAADSTVCWW